MLFFADRSASVVIIFALLFPVLLGVVGVAVDYASWALQRTTLQQAADAAALAVVSDLQVSGANAQRMQALARSYVDGIVKLQRGDGPVVVATQAVTRERAGGPFVTAESAFGGRAPTGVKVTLTQHKHAIMSRLVTPHLTDITVSAIAEAMGSAKLCVVGLASSGASTVRLEDDARIDAGDCAVYALSNHPWALDADGSGLIAAGTTCTVGGYRGQSANFRPLPITGCPPIKDPLKERPAPVVGGCTATDLALRDGTYTLSPGTYCGGLLIEGGAEVTLRPGIYVMQDGPLVVGPAEQRLAIEQKCDLGPLLSTASLQPAPAQQTISILGINLSVGLSKHAVKPSTHPSVSMHPSVSTHPSVSICALAATVTTRGFMKGDGVGIYFTGDLWRSKTQLQQPLLLLPRSVVELTAPRDGPMAGLLFFEDRRSSGGRPFEILSDSARRLVGTIYLPRGIFSVKTDQVVADQSEYTAIVANQILLSHKPRLVINTRYGATNVPVPRGLGPTSGEVGLAN